MNRSKQITLLIFLLLHVTTFAKEHYISLENQSVKIRNFGFYIERVTNATGEDRLIGFVEKKINYQNVPTYFENEISNEIHNFLKRNLMQSTGNISLIVRIDQLQISETYNGVNETASVNVGLTFIIKEGGDYFKKFTTNVNKQKSATMGITKSQPKIIAQAIAQCFDDFYSRKLDGKLENIKIPEQELYNKPNDDNKITNELFSLNRSKLGIYKTFYDFKYNTPDTTINFKVKYKTKSNRDESITIKYAWIIDKEASEDIENIWGFCDEKNNYMLIKKQFLPLNKDNFSYFLNLKVYDQAGMTYAGIMGGLIGSSIAAASTPKSKVRLNLLNGKLEYSEQTEDAIKASDKNETKIIFFASSYNNDNSVLELNINSKIHCILTKGTWYEFKVSSFKENISVILKSTNGLLTTREITPKPFESVIYLCIDNKRKEPNIDRVLLKRKDDFDELMNSKNRVFPIATESE